MAHSPPNVLIASARPLRGTDRDLLSSHPTVQYWNGTPPLGSFWNDLPTPIRLGMALVLWALPHQAPPEQLESEDALRHQLNALGQPYRTLHANGFTEVLQLALCRQPPDPQQTALAQQQWQRWQQRGCEKCSDPVCEHRLFQDLLQQRTELDPKG